MRLKPRTELIPCYALPAMFTLLSSFCRWTKNLTYISQLTSNNVISCFKLHSGLCPSKRATAKTSWELYRFYYCCLHYIHYTHYTLSICIHICSYIQYIHYLYIIYIHIFIYIYILYIYIYIILYSYIYIYIHKYIYIYIYIYMYSYT